MTAVLSATLFVAPTAGAQNVSSTDVDVGASQNVVVSPDPAPQAAPPVQPSPDPVPRPQPASTSGGGQSQAPPQAPAPTPTAPAPQPAADPVADPTPVAAAPAGDGPAQERRPRASGRADEGKRKPSDKNHSTPVDKVNPLPVISGLGPLVDGLGDRAKEAAPPIVIAALALLTLALTSGAFLLVATRRTGARRT